MSGELAAFLAAAAVVKRPRPYVSHLDHHLIKPNAAQRDIARAVRAGHRTFTGRVVSLLPARAGAGK